MIISFCLRLGISAVIYTQHVSQSTIFRLFVYYVRCFFVCSPIKIMAAIIFWLLCCWFYSLNCLLSFIRLEKCVCLVILKSLLPNITRHPSAVKAELKDDKLHCEKYKHLVNWLFDIKKLHWKRKMSLFIIW